MPETEELIGHVEAQVQRIETIILEHKIANESK